MCIVMMLSMITVANADEMNTNAFHLTVNTNALNKTLDTNNDQAEAVSTVMNLFDMQTATDGFAAVFEHACADACEQGASEGGVARMGHLQRQVEGVADDGAPQGASRTTADKEQAFSIQSHFA